MQLQPRYGFPEPPLRFHLKGVLVAFLPVLHSGSGP